MPRKFSVLSLFLVACVLFTSCVRLTVKKETSATNDAYQIVMLGDLHYDSEECREPSALKELTRNRQNEMKLNLRSWCESGESHKMLELAGKTADELKSPFVIQIGDFCQGDAGSEEMATKMILECMATCKNYIHVPFIATKGNHDPRGKGAEAAVNKTLPAFWSKELNLNPPVKKTTFAYRQGPDVFIFLDDISLEESPQNIKVDDVETVKYPNLEYLKSLLQANKDARYKFIVCHLPIIPTADSRWLPFGKAKYDEQRKALLDLLCEYNAIVLCGHVHTNTFIEYANDKGTLAQLTSFSLFRTPKSAEMGKLESGGAEMFMSRKKVQDAIVKDATLREFLEFYMTGLKRFDAFSGAGYCIVSISPEGVTADYRSIRDPDFTTVIKLR